MLAEWMQRGRRFRQCREISRLFRRQFVNGFVEVNQRSGSDAISAETKINFVEIQFKNLVLRVSALDTDREQRLFNFAGERALVADKEVLRDLLGDGRRALRAALAVIFDIAENRARNADGIDAAVL